MGGGGNPIKAVVNSFTGKSATDEAKKMRKQQEKANKEAEAERVKQLELEKQKALAEERAKKETAETSKYQDELGKGQDKELSKGVIAPKGAGTGAGTEWLNKEEDTEVFEDFFF